MLTSGGGLVRDISNLISTDRHINLELCPRRGTSRPGSVVATLADRPCIQIIVRYLRVVCSC